MTRTPPSGFLAPSKPCPGIRQLFEKQVELTPDRVAVVFGDRQLTYRALDQQANQFARYLTKSGVAAETPVGIFMERSIEMVVATWGIFKSGGAYVPLDTAHPTGRLAGMIEDACVRLVVTDSRLKDRLPVHGVQLICPEEAAAAIAQEPAGAIENASHPDRLAYLVYTSGSTGQPKGVLIPDRAFARCKFWAKEVFQFTPDDRFLFKSVRAPEELFFPLFSGALLVIAPPGAEHDVPLLIRTLIRHRITAAGFPPALLGLLLDEANLEGCHWLKHVLCAGEALPADLPRRFLARSTASLYNFYGLAEAPFTTLWRCRPDDNRPVVPIGKPVDAEVYLLNPDLQPVAPGEVGEIYIGGPGLARGY
ncbi:MAG TPA: AMP-binding protein, partial [Chthoniobacterales bacterium]